MKKITRLISFVAIFFATLGITVNAQGYCNEFGTTTSDNTRGWSETVFTTLGVATTVDSKAEGSIIIVAGDTYRGVANESEPVVVYRGKSLKIDLIKGDGSFNWIHFAGYADWNQDKTFEKFFYDDTNTNANRSYELEIPTDAALGQTRIRILMGWFTQDTDPSKDNYYSSCTIKQTVAEPVKNARVLDFLIDVQETTLPDAPTFSVPNGGVIVKGDVVTITSATGTTIKYTTDGSDPATATATTSNSVTVPISADNMQIRAIALNSSAEAGAETTATYRMLDVTLGDYYYIVFERTDADGTIALADQGAGAILQSAVFTVGDDAQLWKVEKGTADGLYKITGKSGNSIYFDDRFKADATPSSATDMKILVSPNGDFTGYEIQRADNTNNRAMNPFGGSVAGNQIGEWNVGDGGNVLNFKKAKPYLIKELEAGTYLYDNSKSETEFGGYAAADKATYKSVLDAAQAVADNATATEAEIVQAINDLKAAKATYISKRLLTNELLSGAKDGKHRYFRIRSASVKVYAAGKVISSAGRVTGDKYTYTDIADSEEELFAFVLNDDGSAIANIMNRAENKYMSQDGAIIEDVAGNTGTFEIIPLEDGLSFKIKPSTKNDIHAQELGEHIVNWNDGVGSSSAWILDFVKDAYGTGVENAVDATTYRVSVVDGMISVTGASAFDVYTLSGQRVNANRQLDKGVYIVKVNDFTQKVIVR